jgi:hypothetical protein
MKKFILAIIITLLYSTEILAQEEFDDFIDDFTIPDEVLVKSVSMTLIVGVLIIGIAYKSYKKRRIYFDK